MSEIEQVKALVKERLKAAVEDIFGIIENVIKVLHEKDSRSKWEIERREDLLELDILLKPNNIKLQREDPSQLSACKEEVPPERQERSPSPERRQERRSPSPDQEEEEEDPEPLQIKEEQEEETWGGAQEGEQQLRWLQEADAHDSMFTVTCVRRLHHGPQHRSSPRLSSQTAGRREGGEEPRLGEEGEPLPGTSSSSAGYMETETEADGEDGYGVSEPTTGDWQPPLSLSSDHVVMSEDADRAEGGGGGGRPRSGFPTESFRMHAVRAAAAGVHHAGSKSYSCGICKKNFRFKSGLTVHMKIHAPYRPYSCTVCGKEMIRFSDFQRHMKTHTGERPYSCSVCGKGFIRRDRVQDHMKTHTGERPYGCSVCGKGFIQSSDLKRHMKTHAGERQ